MNKKEVLEKLDSYQEQLNKLASKKSLSDYIAPEIRALPEFNDFMKKFFSNSQLESFKNAEEEFSDAFHKMRLEEIDRINNNTDILNSLMRFIKPTNEKETVVSDSVSNMTEPVGTLTKNQYESLLETEISISPSQFNIRIKDTSKNYYITATDGNVSFKQIEVPENPNFYGIPRTIEDNFSKENGEITYKHKDSNELEYYHN